ncbi:hypothetical protein, partial [Streptomyces sp. NPDC058698]|uniref:hypothetical protein n=1 Tax=Streptomyces sp. NPDC058698 TaxID=3346606 RepID=UPI0036525609
MAVTTAVARAAACTARSPGTPALAGHEPMAPGPYFTGLGRPSRKTDRGPPAPPRTGAAVARAAACTARSPGTPALAGHEPMAPGPYFT